MPLDLSVVDLVCNRRSMPQRELSSSASRRLGREAELGVCSRRIRLLSELV